MALPIPVRIHVQFLSAVDSGINETLTRLPVGHPLANGPESPIVRIARRVAWRFALGSVLQFLASFAPQPYMSSRRAASL